MTLFLSGCVCGPRRARPVTLPPAPIPIPSDAIVPTDASDVGAPAAGRFAVSPDGAATYNYPVWVPSGRAGVQPSLSLAYNSRSANGLVGVGWSLLGLSSISRCKKDLAHDGFNAAIQFDGTDSFCLDGERLVAFPSVQTGKTGQYGAPGTEYRTEQESFAWIVNGPTDAVGPLQFEVRLKDGRILRYGGTPDSRLEGQRFQSTPASLSDTKIKTNLNQTVRLSWALSEVRDRYGNNVRIEYSVSGDPANQEGYEQLPKAIRYTGTIDNSLSPLRLISFEYEARPDAQTVFVSGLRLQLRDRLSRIIASAPNPIDVSTVKTYQLTYLASKSTARSLLTEIIECDAANVCLTPTIFDYATTVPDYFDDIDTGIHDDTAVGESTPSVGAKLGSIMAGDVNGDGCDDLIFSVYLANWPTHASYALSSCYDAIAEGNPVFPAPTPPFLFQLSPNQSGAPDSNVPPIVFSPPFLGPTGGPPAPCFSPTGAEVWACYNEWLVPDLDLDGRADILSYFVLEDCGNPFPSGCDISTTWNQTFDLSVLLASSVAPAKWVPASGLFGAETQTVTSTSTGKSIFSTWPPNSFYFTSVYIGDINGDGFPDLVRFTPNGWSFRLNHGRFLIPRLLPAACSAPGNACLNLGEESPLFPGTIPVGGPETGLTNVFMTDAFREGTTSLILRDPAGPNWYAANRLTSQNCSGSQFCPILPAPNLALVAGDAQSPVRRDWFIDTNGDGLPDSVSIPRSTVTVSQIPLDGGHPFVATNSGNGFDSPVLIPQGVPVRDGPLAILDYDGNGTQDFIYTSTEAGAQSFALQWLPLDMHGDGRTEIVQIWDNIDKLGMTVWLPNGNDSLSEAWSSGEVGQGSAAIAWLPVDMQGDGKTQIVQLWSYQHKLSMTVWAPNQDDSYSFGWGGDLGQSTDATMNWFAVHMASDKRTQIVQLWDNHNKLGITTYVPHPDGSYSVGCFSPTAGQGSGAVKWVPVDMFGDGRTEIVQIWNNNHKAAFSVWVPDASSGCYKLGGTSGTNQSIDSTMDWLPVSMNGSSTTQIVQLWDNQNELGMTVYVPQPDGTYNVAWTNAHMGQGSGAVKWLPVQMRSARQNGIVQLWNNHGNLSVLVWSSQPGNSYKLAWSGDTSQPSDAVEWLPVSFFRNYASQIVQLRNNFTKLAVNVWTPHFDGSYSLAWQSSDMGGYLYALLTGDDPTKFRSVPLFDASGSPIRSGSNLQALDVNGDGLLDLVQVLDGDIHVYKRRGIQRDLLAQVIDRGADINVNYKPITSAKTYSTTKPPGVIASEGTPTPFSPGNTYVLNRGAWVVASYTVPQAGALGGSPVNHYSYSYSDARMDLQGRGWLGFGGVTVTDDQTHVSTTTGYDNATMFGSAYPLAHRPGFQESTATLTDSGRTNIRRTQTTFDFHGSPDGHYVVVLPKEVLSQEWEGDSIETIGLIRSFDTKLAFDDFGNLTSSIRVTGDGYSDSHSASYQTNTAAWLVSTQTGAIDSSTTPDGRTAERTRSLVPDPNTGVTLSEVLEPAGTLETYQKTTFGVDSHGVTTSVTLSDNSGAQQRTMTVGMDAEDLYPLYIKNVFGDTDRFAIHPAFGTLAVHEDPNRVMDTLQHDTFGRLRKLKPANGASISITNVFPELDITAADGQTVSIYSDPYKNEVERDWLGFNGQTVIVLSSYNSQGQVREVDGPCYYTGTPCPAAGSEQYSYDELGRLIGVVHGDGSNRKIAHRDLRTTQYDEVQNQRYMVEDQLGRLSTSVAIGDSGTEIPIRYRYAPFGLIDTITDSQGHALTTTYDSRGRPTATYDADRGHGSLHWDPFGQLKQFTDGNGLNTFYTRDQLGRVTRITDKSGTTRYCWDTAPKGLGKLAGAQSSDGISTHFMYDGLSRLSSVTTDVSRVKYSLGFTYDPIGRLDTIQYPATNPASRYVVRRHFNSDGYLDQLIEAASGSSLWQEKQENERGQITDEVLGSGLETVRVFDIRGLLRHVATKGSSTTTQELDYTYYPNASLKTRTSALPAATVSEQFSYDALDRLHEWTGTAIAIAPPHGTTPLLDQIFTYDDLGNLKSRRVVAGSPPPLTYQYGQNGAGPHAATQVNTDSYAYDTAGNQTAGPGRIVHYNSLNLPASVRAGADTFHFKYDAFGTRVLTRSSNGDTVTSIGGLYERRVQQRKVTNVAYIAGGHRLVAQAESGAGAASTLHYVHQDYLGSIQAVTSDGTGTPAALVTYQPFGQDAKPDNPDSPSINGLMDVTRGFTQDDTDAKLNLIDMVGRVYDPKLARFLTADPFVPDPSRSESLNPYSYAWNNPLKWTDPSGFQEAPPPDSPPEGDNGEGSCTDCDTNFNSPSLTTGSQAPMPQKLIDQGAYFDQSCGCWGLDLTGVTPSTADDGRGQGPSVSPSAATLGLLPQWMSKDQMTGFHGDLPGTCFACHYPPGSPNAYFRPAPMTARRAFEAAIPSLAVLSVVGGAFGAGALLDAAYGGELLVGGGTTAVVGAKAVADTPQGERLALGLTDFLEDFAGTQDATTWKNFIDPANWRLEMMQKLADPNVTKLFNLQGVNAWQGAARVAAGVGFGPTDWELFQIQQHPEWWNSIQWFLNGQPTPNPFQ